MIKKEAASKYKMSICRLKDIRTGAALLEGRHFVGIEKEKEYFEAAKKRMEIERKQLKIDF